MLEVKMQTTYCFCACIVGYLKSLVWVWRFCVPNESGTLFFFRLGKKNHGFHLNHFCPVGFGYGVVLGCSGTVLFQQTKSNQSNHITISFFFFESGFLIKNKRLKSKNANRLLKKLNKYMFIIHNFGVQIITAGLFHSLFPHCWFYDNLWIVIKIIHPVHWYASARLPMVCEACPFKQSLLWLTLHLQTQQKPITFQVQTVSARVAKRKILPS